MIGIVVDWNQDGNGIETIGNYKFDNSSSLLLLLLIDLLLVASIIDIITGIGIITGKYSNKMFFWFFD